MSAKSPLSLSSDKCQEKKGLNRYFFQEMSLHKLSIHPHSPMFLMLTKPKSTHLTASVKQPELAIGTDSVSIP